LIIERLRVGTLSVGTLRVGENGKMKSRNVGVGTSRARKFSRNVQSGNVKQEEKQSRSQAEHPAMSNTGKLFRQATTDLELVWD
jgi:hypothetical protein